MKQLVEFIAKALVDHPDQVEVSESSGGGRTVVRLQVPKDEMGRVIGKDGNIAQAIRMLLKVAASRQGNGARQPSLIISPLENVAGKDDEEAEEAEEHADADHDHDHDHDHEDDDS